MSKLHLGLIVILYDEWDDMDCGGRGLVRGRFPPGETAMFLPSWDRGSGSLLEAVDVPGSDGDLGVCTVMSIGQSSGGGTVTPWGAEVSCCSLDCAIASI